MIQTPHTNPTFSWKAVFWALIFFWYFSTAIQLVIALTDYHGTNGLRDSLLYSSLWLAPILLFPRYTKLIAGIIGVILWAASVGAICYYVIYRQEFSQSVLFIMFESNTSEASEYIHQYLSFKLVLPVIVYTAIAIFLWTRLRPIYLPSLWRYIIPLALIYGLIINPFGFQMVVKKRDFDEAVSRISPRMETAAPWQIITGFYQYRNQLTAMQKLVKENDALAPLKNLKDANGDTPRTLVLVIGESTQRGRMSLYGYPRETTPNLDTLHKTDPHFTVFNHVVTSRPYTIEILQQALTFGNELHPDLYLTEPSLMNMMEQAGYKSFWITNQQSMTKRNTMLTVFSKQTDKQFYMNQQRVQNAREYDGNVLKPFEEVLADPAPKKFIVVHLLGTHIKYEYRYPENFNKFTGIEGLPKGLTSSQIEDYNTYDNAVLYNDFVVSSLIKEFQATDPNGFLLYFSDHGEEVYDTPPHNIQGRNETAPTRAMYTIPFMIWTSPRWAESHPRDFSSMLDRKYSSSELIHTWSDLAGLSYDKWLPANSLVSPQFKEQPRLIGDPYGKKSVIDFDTLPHANEYNQ